MIIYDHLSQETIRVYSRQSTIIPAMIGHTCAAMRSALNTIPL